MCSSGPVHNGLRHRIPLGPDDIGSQDPAVGLQRQSHPPRYSDQALMRQSGIDTDLGPLATRIRYSPLAGAESAPMIAAGAVLSAGITGAIGDVGIAEDQPQCAIIPQDTPNFPEDLDHPVHVLLWLEFMAKLARYAIIPEPSPVRGAGDDAVNRTGAESAQDLLGITLKDQHRRNLLIGFSAAVAACTVAGPPVGGGVRRHAMVMVRVDGEPTQAVQRLLQ